MTDTNNMTWEERAKAFEERATHIRDMMERRGITEEEILKDFAEWKKNRRDSRERKLS